MYGNSGNAKHMLVCWHHKPLRLASGNCFASLVGLEQFTGKKIFLSADSLDNMSGKKNTALTIKQKLQIISEGPHCSKSELREKYGCSIATINRILKNAKHITEKSKDMQLHSKRNRGGNHEAVEQVLKLWYMQMKSLGGTVTSNMLIQKAKDFAIQLNDEFTPTTGWLWRWQRRNGVSLKKTTEEQFPNDVDSAADIENVTLANMISEYNQSDIFTAGEYGLLYKAVPAVALNMNGCDTREFETSERLSFLFLCNATGDYKKVFVIGKTPNPHCCQNKTLPLKYYANKRAWLTTEIWRDILNSLEAELTQLNRKIVLFVAETPIHVKFKELKHINIQYFPTRSNSIGHPLEQGIVQRFKTLYRQNLVRRQIAALECGKSPSEFARSLNIFQAMHIINYCCWQVQPPLIMNCFIKANFVLSYPGNKPPEDSFEQNTLDSIINSNAFLQNAFEDYNACDQELICSGHLNHDENMECISPQLSPSESTPEENGIINKRPTVYETLQAIQTLRVYFQPQNNFVNELENMESHVVTHSYQHKLQTLITNFFIPIKSE